MKDQLGARLLREGKATVDMRGAVQGPKCTNGSSVTKHEYRRMKQIK